jgi:hypothetical protein
VRVKGGEREEFSSVAGGVGCDRTIEKESKWETEQSRYPAERIHDIMWRYGYDLPLPEIEKLLGEHVDEKLLTIFQETARKNEEPTVRQRCLEWAVRLLKSDEGIAAMREYLSLMSEDRLAETMSRWGVRAAIACSRQAGMQN